jgi:FAD synthase
MEDRVVINGSNIPKELMDIFNQYDMDADPYKEMERLRMKAIVIGYDFDYGLSGEPTEFWKISTKTDNYITR